MRLCFMVFAMFSTIYYNIARKRDATASDGGQRASQQAVTIHPVGEFFTHCALNFCTLVCLTLVFHNRTPK